MDGQRSNRVDKKHTYPILEGLRALEVLVVLIFKKKTLFRNITSKNFCLCDYRMTTRKGERWERRRKECTYRQKCHLGDLSTTNTDVSCSAVFVRTHRRLIKNILLLSLPFLCGENTFRCDLLRFLRSLPCNSEKYLLLEEKQRNALPCRDRSIAAAAGVAVRLKRIYEYIIATSYIFNIPYFLHLSIHPLRFRQLPQRNYRFLPISHSFRTRARVSSESTSLGFLKSIGQHMFNKPKQVHGK